jgi:diguanylate cyclase (GGDEF)-like protein
MLGYEENELRGTRIADLVDEDIRDKFPINAATADVSESVFCTRDGRRIPVSVSCSTITDDDPQFQGSIYVARNITERKRAERRIRYLARYDSLTKIPNRIQFQHLLQRKIARAKRNHRYLGILYVDLDRFKDINDTFGHMAGDLCLETIAQRIVKQLPDKTVVGRLAGDEFGVILENLPSNHQIRRFLSERAREILDTIAGAFYVEESEVFLTGSIGIATYPADAENVIDLIRNADAAMYHAKQHGGNTYEFYTPEMNDAAVERLTLKSKLKRALERDELEIRYQPKIDLRDGKIIGAEALLRWRLIGHGDIPPSTFIPLAEESNLIREIGDWVMRKVCADYGEWQSRVSSPGRIAVNVSLKQLQHPNFMYRIKAIFNEFKISPTCLELEITETTLMHDAKRTLRVLDELYGMGLHLSIDDFGTGYSSLSVLQQFPISTLKIDQSFVRDTAIDSDDATIVKTIIDMGRSMDMEVVAEGVETEEQLSFLRKQDCNYAQGHLFGETLTANEFLEVLLDQSEGTNRHRALFA